MVKVCTWSAKEAAGAAAAGATDAGAECRPGDIAAGVCHRGRRRSDSERCPRHCLGPASLQGSLPRRCFLLSFVLPHSPFQTDHSVDSGTCPLALSTEPAIVGSVAQAQPAPEATAQGDAAMYIGGGMVGWQDLLVWDWFLWTVVRIVN